jgi:serine/threonine protein kinase
MPKFFDRLAQSLQKKVDASPASPPTFGLGALIEGRYRLDGEIGRGGMGIVYHAHDLVNDRDVAIKVINFDESNALSLLQFSREAEITAQLHHPHIVQVYATGSVDAGGREPSPFIVMELVQGVGLDALHDLTYARIIDIVKQICDALAYAHDQGIIYRDLKPANVILEKRGFDYFAKLLDFGLARPRGMDNSPVESPRAGTVYYLAPEVIAGQPADIPSDLYALGALLYEMITGRVPFSNFIDDEAILAQHLTETVAPPSHSRSDVPPALEAIVLRLLEKDPKNRFASAQETLQALGQLAQTGESPACGNLPQNFSSAGRAAETAQLKQFVEANHLVTILNNDESLALASATELASHFPDGVWLIDLASLSEPSQVLPTIAATLRVPADPNRPLTVSLFANLREKNLLLILTHCDHVRAACAQFLETVLQTCPDVRMLVVSAQAFDLPDEKCFPP